MKREDLYVRATSHVPDLDAFITKLGGDTAAINRTTFAALPDNQDVNLAQNKRQKGLVEFLSWAQVCIHFEAAAAHLSDPALGIRWAFDMPRDYRTSGPTMILIHIASNMRHFLDMAIEYQKIHTNGVAYSYEDNKKTGEVTGVIAINPLSPPCRQYCEHIVAGIAVMGYRNAPEFALKRVTFQHNAPKDLSWHEKAFRCPVEFNADRNTLVLDRSILGVEHTPISMKAIKPLLKAYLNWQIDKHPRAKKTMSATVSTMLPNLLGIQKSDVAFVANTLNMHPKKLQRLLADEGTHYSDILDIVRKNTAHRLLSESDISIGRLASMLDYATDRPFTTATKRWFNMTPTQYRRHVRDGF